MSRNATAADRSNASTDSSSDLGISALLGLLGRRKLIFILPVVCALLGVTTIHYSLPVYEARTSLIVQTANSSSLQALSARMGAFGMQEDDVRQLERYVVSISSESFFLGVAQEMRKAGLDLMMFQPEMRSSRLRILMSLGRLLHLGSADPARTEYDDGDMADVLRTNTFYTVAGSDRIAITVRNRDRYSAGVAVNFIAEYAVKRLLEEGLKDLSDARSYIEGQAKEIEKVIRSIEGELSRLEADSNRAIIGGGLSDTTQAAEIRKRITDATLEQDEIQRRIDRLRAEMERIQQDPSSTSKASVDPENRYGLPQKIAELGKVREAISLKLSALRQVLDGIARSESSSNSNRLYELRKRMEFEYSIYEDLKKQSFELDMRNIGANNKVRVSDHVREFGAQRSDNLPLKLVMALILSFFAALPFAVVWEMASPSVRTGRDLTDAGFVFLGGIPMITGRFARDKRQHGPKIARFDSDSDMAMAYVQVRSRLLHLTDRKQVRTDVIAVVSAKPSEGKSFFSRNLAASLGHMGRKTLLIDCDVRKAASSEYFGLLDAKGLGDILTGEVKFGEVVRKQVSRGIDFVPAGTVKTNITDLFAHRGFGELINDLREIYGHVVLDTPSLIAVPDSPLILRSVDFPILLASMNQTGLPDVEVALDRIRALYTGDIYAVLNRVTGAQFPLYVINTGGKRGAGNLFGGGEGGVGA